jgi:hypothetical protein
MELIPVFPTTSYASAIPSTNEQQQSSRRPLPLSLGRRELARWWWDSCPCRQNKARRRQRRPCLSCKRVGQHITTISKSFLHMDHYGEVSFLTRKNRQLVHFVIINKEKRKEEDTTILLRPGDMILIGRDENDPWMKFRLQKRRARRRGTLHQTDDEQSKTKMKKKSRIVVTPGTESANTTTTKQRTGDDVEEMRRGSNPKRRLPFTTSRDAAPPVAAPRPATTTTTTTTRRRPASSLPMKKRVVVPETPPDTVALMAKAKQESDEESSVLSLPQCCSSQSQSQQEVGAEAHHDDEESPPRKRLKTDNSMSFTTPSPSINNEAQQQPSKRPTWRVSASSLSHSDWKQVALSSTTTSKVRSSLAALVVVQRRKLKDTEWLPDLIHDASVSVLNKQPATSK